MKRLFLTILVFILFANAFCASAQPYTAEYVVPSFEELHEVKFGLCEEYSQWTYYLYYPDGRLINKSRFPIKIMNNGLILEVNENGKARFCDIKSGEKTDFIYDTYPRTNPKTSDTDYPYLTDFGKGDGGSDLIPFSKNNKFGFISSGLVEVIPPCFDYAYGFYDGMARICTGGTLSDYGTYINCSYGYINERGEVVLPPDSYWIAEDFKNGYARVSNNGSMYYLIDKNGTRLDFGDASVVWHSDGYVCLTKNGMFCLCDMNGNTVVPFGTDSITPLGESFVIGNRIIDKDGKVLYTAQDGETLVPYDLAIERGLVCAMITIPVGNNSFFKHTGLVSETGTVILDAVYDSVSVLDEGIIFAVSDIGNAVYDYDGNMLFEINASSPERSQNGVFSVLDNATGERVYVKNPIYRKTPHPEYSIGPILKNGLRVVPMPGIAEIFSAKTEPFISSCGVPYAESYETYIVSYDMEKAARMTLKYGDRYILMPATVFADIFSSGPDGN